MIDRKTPPTVETITHIDIPKAEELTLDNGIRVTMLDYGLQPVSQLTLLYPGGEYDVKNSACMSLMGKMLREGTKAFTSQQLSEALDFYGAKLNPISTGHYYGYALTALNSKLADILPQTLTIFTQPTFPENEFKTLQARDVKLVSDRWQHVGFRCYLQLTRNLCGARHPEATLPTADDINAVTLGQVRAMYRRWRSATPYAFIAGRLDPETRSAYLRALEALPTGSVGIDPIIVPFAPVKPGLRRISVPDTMQAALGMGTTVPFKRDDQRYVPLRIAVIALGGYFGSRLMLQLRENLGYTYGIDASTLGSLEGTQIRIAMQCDHQYTHDARKAIVDEIQRMYNTPLTDAEMQRLRGHVSQSVLSQLESPFSVIQNYIQQLTMGCPIDYYAQHMRALETLTPQQISDLIAQYLPTDTLRTVIAQ